MALQHRQARNRTTTTEGTGEMPARAFRSHRERHAGCLHDGFHTPTSRYDHGCGVMRFVLMCDACGAELQDVVSVEYRPHFDRCHTPPVAA